MLNITLAVDKSTNRVVFAEADREFVDILLSFLTLPLGTILSLTKKNTIHCLDNLYKSVQALNKDYLKVHKERLLQPSHAAELECLDLAVNLEGNRALNYYECARGNSCSCNVLSPDKRGARCKFGYEMNRLVKVARKVGQKEKNHGVFLKGLPLFIITDDFKIMPATIQAVLALVGGVGGEDRKRNLEKRCVNLGEDAIRNLLYRSIISETGLSEAMLPNEIATTRSVQKKLASLTLKSHANASSGPAENNISVKLIIDKHENKVICAECDQDFVDLLFNFLTYPSGYVVKNLNGNCHITCFDNLYASAVSPALASQFKTDQAKEYVVNPKLSPSFIVSKPDSFLTLKLGEGLIKSQTVSMRGSNEPSITDKGKRLMDGTDIKGFVCEATYIVTDDLVVTPSISSVMHLIANAKEGVQEFSVNVGNKEVFLLLEAALGSKTALTDVFVN